MRAVPAKFHGEVSASQAPKSPRGQFWLVPGASVVGERSISSSHPAVLMCVLTAPLRTHSRVSRCALAAKLNW